MKILFINILNVCLSSFLLLIQPVFGFQTESLQQPSDKYKNLSPLEALEAGLARESKIPEPFIHLSEGQYQKAFDALTPTVRRSYPWLEKYLIRLIKVSAPLERYESDHFVLFVPKDQVFLKDYALPSLEKTASYLKTVFNFDPSEKIRVEIYPTKEDFSAASTLSLETLKRSGAIGICKFHRLMILSPRALPMGYRWLDALAHEYMHLLINELSWSKAELWLHEGAARYFDTSYRADPPDYLSPNQKTKLLEALEEERLIEFKRMSPSLVYLKNQEEVSLAFAQVSNAIGTLIEDKGTKKFRTFLRLLRKKTFPDSFKKIYGQTPQEFEKWWQSTLAQRKWEKVKGALSDEVQFQDLDEDAVIGASVKGKVRLGDKKRLRKRYFAALIEYKKALKEEPDNAIILLKAARAHLAMGQKKEAIEFLRRAVKSNPNYGTPHIQLAKLVEPKEALELLITANAINPFDPQIHVLKSKVYELLGMGDLAQREMNIARGLSQQ